MVRYGILTIYKCGRSKTYYVVAENRESMWKKFYRSHKKDAIDDASVYSEEIIDDDSDADNVDDFGLFVNEVEGRAS